MRINIIRRKTKKTPEYICPHCGNVFNGHSIGYAYAGYVLCRNCTRQGWKIDNRGMTYKEN